ncbi:MAG TPA: helix-turn-helix domain-containing protein [Marinobacterium sp.]|nr:helix-turn-helix domain-containing protein [Marinobacterium sp.]
MADEPKSNPAIPLFGLYGEAESDNPQFVHLENIASRSSLNAWKIQPHRHGHMFQLLIMRQGEVEVRLDDQLYNCSEPCAISVPAGVVHGFKFKPNTSGFVLTLAEPMVLVEEPGAQQQFASLFEQAHFVRYAEAELLFDELVLLVEQIGRELERADTGRTLMCGWLIRAALLTLRRRLDQIDAEADTPSRLSVAMRRFRYLIEQHYREHWTVERYAQVLGMSADRLNRQAKSAFNTNAKSLISERLILEAKRRLIYTRASLDEIAYDLGFKDPAYFSRAFKRVTGSAPGQYRDQYYDSPDEDSP